MPVTYVPRVPGGWINVPFHLWRYLETLKSLVLMWKTFRGELRALLPRISLPYFLWALLLIAPAFVSQKTFLIQIKAQQTHVGNLEAHVTAALISQGTQKLSRRPNFSGIYALQRGSIRQVHKCFWEPFKWLIVQMFLSGWVLPFIIQWDLAFLHLSSYPHHNHIQS